MENAGWQFMEKNQIDFEIEKKKRNENEGNEIE
jgi:hypothetical protein